MKIFLIVLFVFSLLSCRTVNMDNNMGSTGVGRVRDRNREQQQDEETVTPPAVLIIERPIFVPEQEAPPQRPQGEAAVTASNRAGIIRPEDFSHAAIIFDFHPDLVYEVFTMPLRITDISLQPGERVVETPFVSDSERWILGAGVSYQNGIPVQHVYVKPAVHGISATLIINTDRRVYRIILRSFRDIHMPLVRWRYAPGLPASFVMPPQHQVSENEDTGGTGMAEVDPRFLSFNYRITRGFFSRPSWMPTRVFDDGARTYIVFPQHVLQREMPAIFENRRDIINYRVLDNVVIIDRLIENLTVRIGRQQIIISKRRR